MNLPDAIAFVREHGIVLESARGPVPTLAEAVAGDAIDGNWWTHPRAKEIFRVTRAVRASDEVLVCRLIASKVTFVHERLWPAFVRVGNQLPPESLSRLREQHTASGRHRVEETPFPEWVPADISAQAALLDEADAWTAIRAFAPAAAIRSCRSP